MIPLMSLKKDMLSSRDLADTIDVLKLISSSQFSTLQSRAPKEGVLKNHIIECFDLLTSVSEDNIFFAGKKDAPPAYLLICSDEGFLGEMNGSIVDTALRKGAGPGAKYVTLGERGTGMLKDSGAEGISFPCVPNDVDMEYIINISNRVFDLYTKGEIGSLSVLYMKFISFTNHKLETAKLLPCSEVREYIKGDEKKRALQTLIEPSGEYVLEYLIKLWLENNLHYICWSSKLSEWSIKTMHLDHSSDELKEINKDLKFKYFKTMHAINDKVIREIFAARSSA